MIIGFIPVFVIDRIASYRNKQVKRNTQKYFDIKVLEKLNARDKLFKKFKNMINKELYKKVNSDASKLIISKSKHSLGKKLSETIGKTK